MVHKHAAETPTTMYNEIITVTKQNITSQYNNGERYMYNSSP